MAEMTAENAVEWLTSDKAFGQECYSRKQIAAVIEQQAAVVKKVEDFDLVVVMNKKICSELDAAKARVAELEQQQFAGQTWVTFNEHMKALNKIKQMEDAIKFDFEKFMEFQRRAEQAESQCAAYKKALDIAMSTNQSHETYCKVEAALEGKP